MERSEINVDDCLGCGRNTAPGTRLFSDRVRLPAELGELPAVVCGDCHAAATQRAGHSLSAHELRGRVEGAQGLGMMPGP